MSFIIRPATLVDIPAIHRLISELANYEKLATLMSGTEAMLQEALFGITPTAECLIALQANKYAGFAIYYQTFSSFQCRAGMYLEDIYVIPSARHGGIGKALLKQVTQIALQRQCGRFEWRVLDWNQPAIDFYQSLGATILPEWHLVRLSGQQISDLGNLD